VSVATRAVPLGQTEAQGALARLLPVVAEVAAETAEMPVDAIASSAFGADLATMAHETLPVRLFKT
jgi:urease accessory protein